MLPLVGFVGHSNSGKTTIVKGLIRELVARGYRVGAVKHAHHGFRLGTSQKDSEQLISAGATPVLIISPDRYAIVESTPDELLLSQSLPLILQCDIVLVEGFKGSSIYPRVEVYRQENENSLVLSPKDLSAVVTNVPLDINIPQFSFEELPKLATWVESTIKAIEMELDVQLTVNGQTVGLNPFATKVLGHMLLGAVSVLKGGEAARRVQVSLKYD